MKNFVDPFLTGQGGSPDFFLHVFSFYLLKHLKRLIVTKNWLILLIYVEKTCRGGRFAPPAPFRVKNWISIFGRPSKIISGNKGDFSSEEFTTMAEALCNHVCIKAAESSWSNSISEHYKLVLEEIRDIKSEMM